MLKVTLKNGNEYELLEDTTVYPSGSPNARSRMEIHMEMCIRDRPAADRERAQPAGRHHGKMALRRVL